MVKYEDSEGIIMDMNMIIIIRWMAWLVMDGVVLPSS